MQGVGFRPFVYTLVHDMGLEGTVYNTPAGATVELCASKEETERFVARLRRDAPPLARIERITLEAFAPCSHRGFRIAKSRGEGDVSARVPPDTALCAACEKELYDPANRRFRYPFITCTDCGVRYTIIERLPYDRPNTSMRFFPMCAACEAEYRNPADRRYHAQPIGCFECGPRVSLYGRRTASGAQHSDEVIAEAARLLRQGDIVAVKGVGGFHLMCDATNDAAVARLRERKHRPHKPLAVMVRTLEEAKRYARIDEDEAALLTSAARPIVLLRAADASPLSDAVAPGVGYVGVMLPYTALHLLLLDAVGAPLVATSANRSGEPLCTDEKSLEKLADVYDAVLTHDRPIVNGCDDSVMTVVAGRRVTLRRARGYAPASLTLPFALTQPALALGAHQKNTVAIGFGNQAIVSPHIGDLDNVEAMAYYERTVATLLRLYDFTPERIVCDAHPRYASTRFADTMRRTAAPHKVFHHRAHMLGAMAEHGLRGEAFGVVWDGTGLGEDGTLWGGEFFVGGYADMRRVGHLRPVALLGGEKAVREPRRAALSVLFDIYGEAALTMDLPAVQAFAPAEARTLFAMWQKGLNAPKSSSMGRMFDAAASLLGVCQVMSFEGQSGLMLEALYDEKVHGVYPFEIDDKGAVDMRPAFEAMLRESDTRTAASRLFHTLVEIIARVYAPYAHLPLVCSGGVFQNRILLALVLERFPDAVLPERFPPNDGGIALGQLVFAPESASV